MCIAVGNVSFDDCPMLTSSFGCTGDLLPILRMPKRVYHAYGYVKKAAALVNDAAGRLSRWKAEAIARAADEAIAGKLDQHFPLYVWQTGSGTQSNMNVNEVLLNRGIQLLGAD
jgi:fumarate hydratase, class II